MKRTYETIVIYDPGLDDNTIEQKILKAQSIISANGGEVQKLEKWGKRTLAYEIKKRREGYYIYTLHQSEPTVVAPLTNWLLLDESLLKHMTVVVEEIKKSRYTPKKKKETAPEEPVKEDIAEVPAAVVTPAPEV